MTVATLPEDYGERVYAGCLGKVIGVYLGRPFENWTHQRILEELGPVRYFVNDRVGVPLVVTDDDISGTFTFVRALADHGTGVDITPAQIGRTWLNYIIEGRTILWWSGVGNSTEHTAFLRLKRGVPAPDSGSIARNGRVVAEQIGAQFFIDGWTMVSPGNPAQAASLATRAGSVSHDGEALHSAAMLAAMEAAAFGERDVQRLLDIGLSVVPADSVIARPVWDLRRWHADEPDWRRVRQRLEDGYGYQIWGGNCHTVPNFGVIVLALLWGGGDWDASMTIVNTCGWDTDCNSGNLGCLLGIRNGLSAFDAQDWRGPVADRMYLSTADGGRAIADVLSEAEQLVAQGCALSYTPYVAPKSGARFHFTQPGSVQGFTVDAGDSGSIRNVRSDALGCRVLRLHSSDGRPVTATTPTFVPPKTVALDGYELLASPTFYPGQSVHARVRANAGNGGTVGAVLVLRHYGPADALVELPAPVVDVEPGGQRDLRWTVPDLSGQPIASVGVRLQPADAAAAADLDLDRLTWDGEPTVVLRRPDGAGAAGTTMWHRAWVDAVDDFDPQWPTSFRVVRNEGRGIVSQGTRDWHHYTVTADVTPHLASEAGIAARVQGLHRYYALLLTDSGEVRLVRRVDTDEVLAAHRQEWVLDRTYVLSLEVDGRHLVGRVDGRAVADLEDADSSLDGGGVGLVVADGRLDCQAVTVVPAPARR